MAIIGLPRVVDLLQRGTDFGLWDLAALIGSLIGAVLCLVSRVVITPDGVERRPGTVRIRWAEVVRLEPLPRADRVLSIRVVRTKGRRIMLTPFWMSHERGRALLDRLNEALVSR